MNNPTTPRVALVYHLLPHYREPVLRLLSESKDIEYHFLADPKGEAGIRPIPRDHLPRTHDLTNRWVGPFLFQQGLFSTLRRVRPDVVIFHADYRYLTTWLNAVILRASGKRVIFWTQGWRRPESGPRASVRRAFYRIADHLLVYGPRARQLGIAAGFSPDRITAIGNSHITAEDLASVPTHRIEADALRIGAVMRLVPNKKVTQLAEIAASLTRTGTPTHVHIAGDGPDAVALTAACAAAGVPLRSYGAIHSPDELADYYAELDICVIPGAAGLSVLQALAHGRPVVTNNNLDKQGPEVEVLLDGAIGTLVTEDDTDAFVEAITNWASQLDANADSIASTCVNKIRSDWVADHQADLIAQTVKRKALPRFKVAVINPNASKNRYSGPNIFMERLFAENSACETTIITGIADTTKAFPWATVISPTDYKPSGRASQLRWMLMLTRWLWANAPKYDVIHAHGIYLFNLLPLGAAQLRSVPVILLPLGTNAELGFTSEQGRKQPLAGLRRQIIARAAFGLALSRRTEQELAAAGLPAQRIGSIGNPVDASEYRPPEPDGRHALQQIGFIGALSSNKSPDLILEALAITRARHGLDSARAIFVGPFYDSSYEAYFMQRVHDLGLDESVELTGYTNTVTDHVQQMTAFVLPSKQEGLPGSLVESMAAGVPAIVTDVGAMGDVVRESRAGIVIDRDVEHVADAIARVLASEETWLDLSRNARTYAVNHYSIPAVQQAYARTLEGAITWKEQND